MCLKYVNMYSVCIMTFVIRDKNQRDTVYRSCYRCSYFDVAGVNNKRSVKSLSCTHSGKFIERI